MSELAALTIPTKPDPATATSEMALGLAVKSPLQLGLEAMLDRSVSVRIGNIVTIGTLTEVFEHKGALALKLDLSEQYEDKSQGLTLRWRQTGETAIVNYPHVATIKTCTLKDETINTGVGSMDDGPSGLEEY